MKKKIKVLAAFPSFLKRINRTLFNRWNEQVGEVCIVAPKSRSNGKNVIEMDPAEPCDATLLTMPIIGKNPRLSFYSGLFKYCMQFKPDAIFLENDPASVQSIIAGFGARLIGAKTFCISCDNHQRSFSKSIRAMDLRLAIGDTLILVLSWISRTLVDHVFCINSDILKIQSDRGFKNRSSVIPLGVDEDLFRPDSDVRTVKRTELKISESDFVVAYFGRVSPEKGVDILISALKSPQLDDVVFLIDSFSDYRSDYQNSVFESLKNSALKERVRFFEASHEEIWMYMNAADCAVVPSISYNGRKEQYGRVAPEAMLCRVPIIATRCGALGEILDGGAFFVSEGSVEELIAAMVRMRDDSLFRDHLAVEGHKLALANLTVSAQSEKMLATVRKSLDVTAR